MRYLAAFFYMKQIDNINSEIVNVPIRLYKKYKGSKEDKEALAFAICVKLVYGDSILRDLSVKKMVSIFHMSTYRAKRIINNLNNYPELFNIVGNRVFVLSFKDKTIKENRKGQKYISDYCKKVSKGFNNFEEIYQSIAKTLVAYAINSGERKLLSTNFSKKCSVEITQKNLSNVSGISRSQVSRLTNKMKKNGEICKENAQIKLAISCVNDTTMSEYKAKNGRKRLLINTNDNSAYTITPCRYSINKRELTDSFQHVIYDNWTRIKSKTVRVKRFYKDPYENPIMDAYN